MKRRFLKDVDWSLADGLWVELSNREIAQCLRTTYSKVTAQRAKAIQQALASGRSATPFERVRPERVCYDWSLADGLWQDLTNRELAQRLGIRPRKVVIGRRMLVQKALASGQPTTPFVCRKAKTHDWSQADG